MAGLLVVASAGAVFAAPPALSGTSSATQICIVGSTAYRGGVTKAIEDILGGSSNFDAAWVAGSHGQYNGNEAIYYGTIQPTASGSNSALIGSLGGAGNNVVIKTYWTGSAAGCLDVSSTTNVSGFIPDSYLTSGTGAISTYTAESDVPNIAMSDSFATSVAESIYGAPSVGSAYSARITSANLHQAGTKGETVAGIVPFLWVAGAQTGLSAPPFTNISQQAALELCSAGRVPEMELNSSTAGVSNTTDWVFLVGRNEDSGTRICAQAEGHLGITTSVLSFGLSMNQFYVEFTANNGSVKTDGSFPNDDSDNNSQPLGPGQANNLIQIGGTNCSVVDAGLWPSDAPVNTEPTIDYQAEGHSGQIGGGDVAAVLESINPLYLNMELVDGGDGTLGIYWDHNNSTDLKQKAYLVGYLGSADATGIPGTAGCTFLTYNGVPYSPANIQNGSYTFWSFEHMYYRTDTASNALGTGSVGRYFADDLGDVVALQDCQTNSSGVTDTSLTPGATSTVGGLFYNSNVFYTRTAEGQPVTPVKADF